MKNKNILVIGADGGIGSNVVNQLLSDGFLVIGTYFKSTIQVDKLRDNKNFVSCEVDISNINSVKELGNFVGNKELFAVINCSGVFGYEGESIEKDIKVWNEMIGVNLSGNYYLSKFIGSKICKNGRFVMISSTDSFYGSAISMAYAASKAGINSLTKSLSLLFKDKMIRVNTIAPGWVLTPMTEGIGEGFLNKVAKTNPLKRNAKPIDITNVVSFLLTEKADYINGQVISVEGGYTNQDPTLMLEENTL